MKYNNINKCKLAAGAGVLSPEIRGDLFNESKMKMLATDLVQQFYTYVGKQAGVNLSLCHSF